MRRREFIPVCTENLNGVGLTFQQIQKYERGSNRIGSSRLYEFAKVLDVPVSYFFDEMPSNALSGHPISGRGRKGFGEAGTPFEQEKDPLIKRETLELVRAYYKIRESRVRKRIFEMVKAVGAASHAEVLGGRKGHKPRRASSSWSATRNSQEGLRPNWFARDALFAVGLVEYPDRRRHSYHETTKRNLGRRHAYHPSWPAQLSCPALLA
jgi:transcriptional regulator with XRE-family HTH domain